MHLIEIHARRHGDFGPSSDPAKPFRVTVEFAHKGIVQAVTLSPEASFDFVTRMTGMAHDLASEQLAANAAAISFAPAPQSVEA